MDARDQFVATVKELFETDEQTFNTTYSLGYYNSVRSNTYQGKKPARYSDVQMLWEVFRAAYKPEYTFDQLTKLMMQAATKEGHKVTMKIKWAQPPTHQAEQWKAVPFSTTPAPEGGEK